MAEFFHTVSSFFKNFNFSHNFPSYPKKLQLSKKLWFLRYVFVISLKFPRKRFLEKFSCFFVSFPNYLADINQKVPLLRNTYTSFELLHILPTFFALLFQTISTDLFDSLRYSLSFLNIKRFYSKLLRGSSNRLFFFRIFNKQDM